MIQLHVGIDAEVSSARHLTFFVDTPPREMQIFSGIAIPQWDSKKNLDYAEVLVHFNVDGPPGTYPNDWEYTATTSLASIVNEGSDCTFATDECKVLVDENTGELLLWARIAVLGDPAWLYRFSYHVEVLSKIPIKGAVFGTIRWSEMYGGPKTKGASPMFMVGPVTYLPPPPLGGGGDPGGWQWDSKYSVPTSVTPLNSGGYWAVPYAIVGLPLDQPLNIMPKLLDSALDGPPGPFSPYAAFVPPAHAVTLTAALPAAAGLDFEMTFPVVG